MEDRINELEEDIVKIKSDLQIDILPQINMLLRANEAMIDDIKSVTSHAITDQLAKLINKTNELSDKVSNIDSKFISLETRMLNIQREIQLVKLHINAEAQVHAYQNHYASGDDAPGNAFEHDAFK